MTEWTTAPLPEVLEFREGPGIMARDFREEGVPLIRLSGLKRGAHILDGANYLDPAIVSSRWSQFRLREGDTLLSTSASLGEVARVTGAGVGAVPYTGIICFRPLDDRVEPAFIQHMLTTRSFAEQIEAMGVGSVMKHFGPTHLRHMTVSFPSPTTQRAISDVLGALDEKTAANRRVASSALKLADALYLKEAQEVEVRVALGTVAITVLGGTPSRNVPEYWAGGNVPWIASGKANADRILEPSEWITEEALAKSAAKMMPARATVVAITGATLGQVARLEFPSSGNQSLVGIWSEDPDMNDWLYFAVRHEIEDLLKHATGAAQQHVNKGAVESMLLPIPSPDRVRPWGSLVRPLLDRAAAADRESLVLAATRDELLPLLMSGKLHLKGVQQPVEGVFQ